MRKPRSDKGKPKASTVDAAPSTLWNGKGLAHQIRPGGRITLCGLRVKRSWTEPPKGTRPCPGCNPDAKLPPAAATPSPKRPAPPLAKAKAPKVPPKEKGSCAFPYCPNAKPPKERPARKAAPVKAPPMPAEWAPVLALVQHQVEKGAIRPEAAATLRAAVQKACKARVEVKPAGPGRPKAAALVAQGQLELFAPKGAG